MRKSKFYINSDFTKKQEKLDCFLYKIPLYRIDLVVMVKHQAEELRKHWKRGDCGAETISFIDETGEILVLFYEESVENIVHELHHVVDLVMNSIGHVRYKNDVVDEPSAYLIGHLFTKVVKLFEYKLTNNK